MTRSLAALMLVTLTACGGGTETATFACPNGPDLAITYTEESATVRFDNGRVEVLPAADETTYAKPGVVWQTTGFRSARLTDGQKSYTCDQSSI